MKRLSTLAAVGGIALLAAASMTLGSQEVVAADHADAPGTMADGAADIADFYAWHTDDGKIVAVLTFAALQGPGAEALYDRDVLYTVHIDNTAAAGGLATPLAPLPDDNSNDNVSDIDINIRFGMNELGDWGVQIENLPGVDGLIQAAVGTEIDGGDGNLAQAGTYDDPFFFDLTGFQASIANAGDEDNDDDPKTTEYPEEFDLVFGSLADFPNSITPAPDALAGTNVHGIVLEFDAAAALNKNPDGLLQLWATTSRISE